MIRLALVEDDSVYRSRLREYIEKYSAASGEKFTVTEFSDGDEIALGYKAVYDIILMDIEMKFMDGMMAAEEIRKVDTEVIIIFITNSPQYAIKGYAVDALDYVLKPVSYYAFSQRLSRAIERVARRARQSLRLCPAPVSVHDDGNMPRDLSVHIFLLCCLTTPDKAKPTVLWVFTCYSLY